LCDGAGGTFGACAALGFAVGTPTAEPDGAAVAGAEGVAASAVVRSSTASTLTADAIVGAEAPSGALV
jgi:hypothetical protein